METEPSHDNPEPSEHHMTGLADSRPAAAGLDFAMDRIAVNIHGDADSHIDALCHVIYDGKLYNGVPPRPSHPRARQRCPSTRPATESSVAASCSTFRGCAMCRGWNRAIMLPSRISWPPRRPRAFGSDEVTSFLCGSAIAGAVMSSDRGPPSVARAGLHPTALEFLAERQVALLGSDGNNDTAPSTTVGVEFPVHTLAINAMGLHLLDYLQFEDLVPICEQERRWSFLSVIAPLRLPATTGSPVNPIAIF